MAIYKSFSELEASGKSWSVIYADPPWDFSNSNVKRAGGQTSNVKDHYETSGLVGLKSMPVENVAAENAVLLLWTTDAHLEWAMQVGQAWGFKYATLQFVWHKLTSKGNTAKILGPWGMKSCESCLLFTKGKAHSRLLTKRNSCQLHSYKRTKHSAKPLEFRQEIQELFCLESPLELFARNTETPGWDYMGNEL